MPESTSTVVDQIENGNLLLPEFQRGYVWNRDQVRGLMRSLYLGYPVGSLLVWQTKTDTTGTRGTGPGAPGYVDLLLDGQQRMTSLYGIMKGRAPDFFEGNAQAFTGLHFNMDEETFEFYRPSKMRHDPVWIDITELMQEGVGPFIARINASEALQPKLAEYLTRLAQLEHIKQIEFHIEKITGEDKTVDVVVEIFDRVNSGGTKLSKADLALAKLCAEWPAARERLRAALARWRGAGFNFKIDWLLRIVNAVVTGEAIFTALKDVTPEAFSDGLERSEKAVDRLLNNISSHLGLDHDRVLAGRYGFPVMARYLNQRDGAFPDAVERDRLLHWYVQSFLWARYVGASETILNRDLDALDEDGIDGLVEQLRIARGDLGVRPEDFSGNTIGARFYPLLYLLTRVEKARDFWNGAPVLSAQMLGKNARLEVHHIFPKSVLYDHGYPRGQVNAIANFCFLTQETNLWVGKRLPTDYFAEVEEKYPGALASQWIPLDQDLWTPERYPDFLHARRELLAAAANRFFESLVAGREEPGEEAEEEGLVAATVVSEPDEQTAEVETLVGWMREEGYAEPELDVEITDPDTGTMLAIAEAAWLNGLQEGLGDPVLLELELEHAAETRLIELGYRVFGSVEALRNFVELRAREAAGEAIEQPALV